jgi:hypothetical protein
MTDVERAAEKAAVVAGIVNGLLVLFVPLMIVVWLDANSSSGAGASVVVRPDGAGPLGSILRVVFTASTVVLPFAGFATWRTWAYARSWARHRDGWLAVLEAGLLGFGVAIFVLWPGLVSRPLDAPPYLLVYGGGALVVGLVVGLVLRMTAIGTLRFWRRSTRPA